MKPLFLALCLALLGALCLAPSSGAVYVLDRGVLGTGAGITATGPSAIHGTAGQVCIGQNGTGSLLEWIGFWYTPPTPPSDVPSPTTPIPSTFHLDQNHPNPGWGETFVPFALPRTARVTLRLYDASGRRIATVLDEERPAGFYVETLDVSRLPGGIYFYELRAGSFVKVRKLVVVD